MSLRPRSVGREAVSSGGPRLGGSLFRRSAARAASRADQALTGAALRGDRAAWDVLIAQHTPRVMAFLVARGLSRPVAEDLTQTTWMRLVRAADEGRIDHLKLPGLALTQARFLLLQRFDRRTEELLDDWPPKTADLQADPELLTHDRATLSRVMDAIDTLSPRARQVFDAVYVEQLPAKDAAEQLGISVQRVRQSLCETRKRLRAARGDA